MSRRDGYGQSHRPQNVPEEIRREDRPPSLPHPRYPEPPPPSTPHARSDPPQYTPYQQPPPSSRLSYPPDRSPRTARHTAPPQRHVDVPRSHDRGLPYPRQSEYYHRETALPPVHQPAPRQRTAVACRYCRRRKIRCSGYQSSPDGRCTNCVQRDQKCEFLPVSASPYDPQQRSEAPYITPPQTIPQPPLAAQRASVSYAVLPPPPPYRLQSYESPVESRKPLARPAEEELLSPPRKRQAVERESIPKPVLAPIETMATSRRRQPSRESRPTYVEPRTSIPSDYARHSPPYSAAPSPERRRGSMYSSTTTATHSLPSAMSARSSEISPYSLLPPPRPMSPSGTPVQRRYSYQPQTPYSPEHPYPPRPISQGLPHMASPISAVGPTLPPPSLTYSRSSPILHYASGPPRAPTEYMERPAISPQYDYPESTALPPLTSLRRDTPPVPIAPTMPSPIPLALPPPSGMITAPRNPRDSEILSAFDTVYDSPSSRPPPPKRSPTPDPPARK